ncbi:MAG: DMT family transporter [archaeon]|nr:DMT family transporter [archaeon]
MDPQIRKGIIYAIITLLAISTQPIITKSRSSELDSIFYAICCVFFESLMALPVLIFQTMKITQTKNTQLNEIKLRNKELKKNWWRFPIIGFVFALSQILFFYGFDLSDAISGAIALKSSTLYTIFSGWLFLDEKASVIQIIFSILIIFGLIFTLTNGSFNTLNINLGTLILVLIPILWAIGHTLTKNMLKKEIIDPFQVIFLRTSIGTVILSVFYFSFTPFEKILLIFKPNNLISILLIAGSYFIGHIFWYLSIKNIDLALSSAIQAPQPILTTIYAILILQNEVFTYYHLIGLIIIIISILIIIYDKNKSSNKKSGKIRTKK